MRTNKDYIFREIADDKMLIPTGVASQKLNGMIHLTETAAFIWQQVDVAENLDQIIQKMMEEFDVNEEIVRQDVYGFLRELYNREMVYDIAELEAERLQTGE